MNKLKMSFYSLNKRYNSMCNWSLHWC